MFVYDLKKYCGILYNFLYIIFWSRGLKKFKNLFYCPFDEFNCWVFLFFSFLEIRWFIKKNVLTFAIITFWSIFFSFMWDFSYTIFFAISMNPRGALLYMNAYMLRSLLENFTKKELFQLVVWLVAVSLIFLVFCLQDLIDKRSSVLLQNHNLVENFC